MRVLKRHPFVAALRNYLVHRISLTETTRLEDARRELIHVIPRRGMWYLCEVDGRDYAVRVSHAGRIEIMQNIFNGDERPLASKSW